MRQVATRVPDEGCASAAEDSPVSSAAASVSGHSEDDIQELADQVMDTLTICDQEFKHDRVLMAARPLNAYINLPRVDGNSCGEAGAAVELSVSGGTAGGGAVEPSMAVSAATEAVEPASSAGHAEATMPLAEELEDGAQPLPAELVEEGENSEPTYEELEARLQSCQLQLRRRRRSLTTKSSSAKFCQHNPV